MVHDHAAGLHEGVADGRPDEVEAGLAQRLAHGLGFRGNRRHLGATGEMVDLRLAADEGPEEPSRVVQLQPGLGVLPRSVELGPIANDAGVCLLYTSRCV